MRNDEDPATTAQPPLGPIPDAMMDTMEQWCTKKSGIQYVGPRKQVPFIDEKRPPAKTPWLDG